MLSQKGVRITAVYRIGDKARGLLEETWHVNRYLRYYANLWHNHGHFFEWNGHRYEIRRATGYSETRYAEGAKHGCRPEDNPQVNTVIGG